MANGFYKGLFLVCTIVTTMAALTVLVFSCHDLGNILLNKKVGTVEGWHSQRHKLDWSAEKSKYSVMILLALAASILASIIQIGFASRTFLCSSKNYRRSVLYWIIINVFVLLLLVLVIVLPLSYDEVKEKHNSIETVLVKLKEQLGTLSVPKTLQESFRSGLMYAYIFDASAIVISSIALLLFLPLAGQSYSKVQSTDYSGYY